MPANQARASAPLSVHREAKNTLLTAWESAGAVFGAVGSEEHAADRVRSRVPSGSDSLTHGESPFVAVGRGNGEVGSSGSARITVPMPS